MNIAVAGTGYVGMSIATLDGATAVFTMIVAWMMSLRRSIQEISLKEIEIQKKYISK